MSSSSDPRLLHWELVYKLIENDIKKKEDVLVAVLHVVLINSGFSCIGLGNTGVLTGSEKKCEYLPAAWNDNQDFAIRYIKDEKVHVLRTTHMDEELVVNFLNVSESKVTSVVFNVPTTVAALKGDLNEIVPNSTEVVKKIRTQLLESDKETGTQTQTCQQELRESRSTPPTTSRPPIGHIPGPLGPLGPDRFIDPLPFGYGRSDLDPFSQGGGMIFNPRGPQDLRHPGLGVPGGLPRGSVPPGARFDPMGPLDPDRRRGPNYPGPDPDHMPPPGYDSMFM